MKSLSYFATAAALAGISVLLFSWGAQSTIPVSSECTFASFLIIENPECGWSRVAYYGSRAVLGVALLFTLARLISRRREKEDEHLLAVLGREHNKVIYN